MHCVHIVVMCLGLEYEVRRRQRHKVSRSCDTGTFAERDALMVLSISETRDVRPILDLQINECIACKKFSMRIRLLELLQPGNWFTTIHLRDAYFHVEVLPKHRKFLHFAFQRVAYEYNRLLQFQQMSGHSAAVAMQPGNESFHIHGQPHCHCQVQDKISKCGILPK